MTYFEFLKGYSISKDHGCDVRGVEGWEDWLKCRNNNDGICRKSGTGKFYRFTTTQEKRGCLDWRLYKVGKRIATVSPCKKKRINKYHGIIAQEELEK